MRIAYVNGDFVPLEEAKISVLDRGFLFADGVYEVTSVLDGRLVDAQVHLGRLERSLDEIGLNSPVPLEKIVDIEKELVERNSLREGMVYFQITRGAAEREFGFPKDATPSLVMFTQEKNIIDSPVARNGIEVITVPDIRWERRDIKSIALLAQVLAKQAAVDAGAYDAWMHEDGVVTEGSSNSAFIVAPNGHIISRAPTHAVLDGLTRRAILALAQETQLVIEEREFTVAEALQAKEAFITSASNFVCPVVKIDDTVIGNGKPGPIATRLRELYIDFARRG